MNEFFAHLLDFLTNKFFAHLLDFFDERIFRSYNLVDRNANAILDSQHNQFYLRLTNTINLVLVTLICFISFVKKVTSRKRSKTVFLIGLIDLGFSETSFRVLVHLKSLFLVNCCVGLFGSSLRLYQLFIAVGRPAYSEPSAFAYWVLTTGHVCDSDKFLWWSVDPLFV